jgi:DNA-binding transcriptional LysR family regulator
MTPSATSHALRALESALGAAVVDRNAPGVALTDTGRLILPHVRDVFAALQLVRNIAAASAGLKIGTLRLGSLGASASLRLLPPLLESFRRRHPGVEVFVVEKPDAEVEQDLKERRIEIGVIALPKPHFDTQHLASDELVAVLPERHPLAASTAVTLPALAHYPLVLTHAGSQDLIARMFAAAGLRPNVTHELSQLLSILEFVARGQGVSIVASLALPASHRGVVYRALSPRAARPLGLACLNANRLSPAASALWRQAKALRRTAARAS